MPKKPSLESILVQRGDQIGADGSIKKAASTPASWNPDARTARFILTTENVDRYGDIVVQSGLNLDRFLENPQALMFHNSRNWPVGSWEDVTKINGRPKRTEGTLRFMPEGDDPDADRAARHVAAGTIRTISIGFRWIDYELIRDDDDWIVGVKFTESELLEASLVPIPANPDCLVKDAAGDMTLARELLEEVLEKYELVNGIAVPRKEYDMARTKIVGTKTSVQMPPAEPEAKPVADKATTALVGREVRLKGDHPHNVGSPIYAQIGDAVGKVQTAARRADSITVSVLFEKDGEEIEVTGLDVDRIADAMPATHEQDATIATIDTSKISASEIDASKIDLHENAADVEVVRDFLAKATTGDTIEVWGQIGKDLDAVAAADIKIVIKRDGVEVETLDARGEAGVFDMVEARQKEIVRTSISSLSIDIDTKEAEAGLNRLGALADAVAAKIHGLFSRGVIEERAEPTFDAPAPASDEAISEARAKADVVMKRLAEKKLIGEAA